MLILVGAIWNTRSRAKFTDGARFFTGGTGFIGTLMQFAFRLSEKLPFFGFYSRREGGYWRT